MNTETKRHIDAARQVLVGVVPNPTSQIDQITNALIYKFMDDMDQASIKSGGEPSFFVGDLEKYAWTRLMDTKIGNQDRMNLYVEALSKFSESANLPELFRNIFRSAFLPYRSPEVLGLFLKEINYFDYSHPEELGNAYEYLLSIMSSQGDAGQFRTPRHIIDFIVDVVNPTKEERVLDPACGTGGFLVSAYRRILEHHDGKNDPEKKEKPLTPDDRKNIMNSFEGYDIDPGMVRIAQVNMYLHQFKNPKIYQYDTLSMDERWNDKFDVILANPPFMSPKGGIKPHSKFSMQSTRSEVLFVDYIKNHLRPNGRAGIIVPEGIIFQSGTAYKQLRKALVEDGLYAVVSLPSGVFQPYSGVKTSILLFDNQIAKLRDSILFVKVENDGYTLGATRTKFDKNDLPKAKAILAYYKESGQLLTEKVSNAVAYFEGQEVPKITWSDMALMVEKKKIAEDGDYNLSVDRYRVATDYTNAKWPMVELGEVVDVLNGYAFKSENYTSEGTRIIRITNVQKGEIVDNDPKFYPSNSNKEIDKFLLNKNDLLISLTGNVGRVGLLKADLLPAALNQRVGCIRLVDNKKTTINYLFRLLNTKLFEEDCIRASSGVAQKNLSTEWLKKYKIPLPPLEIQEQIIEHIDSYQKIIDGAKQVVENWKPKIEIDPGWEKTNVGELFNTGRGRVISKLDLSRNSGEYPVFSSQTSNNGEFGKINTYDFEGEYITWTTDGANAGTVFYRNGRFNCTNVCGTAKPKNDKSHLIDLKFVAVLLNDLTAPYVVRVGNPKLMNKEFERIQMPLPPIDIQRKIIAAIEEEKAIVESARQLIEIYKNRIDKIITKLWQD